VKATERSPSRISPAVDGSTRQDLAFTDLRDVVSQSLAPLYANTSGVQWGPFGV
jgi:hypothetical protein